MCKQSFLLLGMLMTSEQSALSFKTWRSLVGQYLPCQMGSLVCLSPQKKALMCGALLSRLDISKVLVTRENQGPLFLWASQLLLNFLFPFPFSHLHVLNFIFFSGTYLISLRNIIGPRTINSWHIWWDMF